MVQGYYSLVIKELKALGYAYDSNAKGSHERWTCPGRRDAIVPRNLNSRHTANGILKTADSQTRF
jgi:predicted RNA binding protein YcfA (HicA-like mRNA interferase family)